MDDTRDKPLRKRSARGTILVVALTVCAAIAGLVYLQGGVYGTPARPEPDSLQQAILNASRDKAGDASLGLLFDQLNTRHFGGRLPNVKVLWEGDLDRLDVGDYRLDGMTDGRIVLIKAALKDDDADVRRTLCHEMVHVKFLAAGNRSTVHDAPFQSELRRIFDDGCFPAIWASPDEKASLEEWIDSERTRLDAVRAQVDAQSAAVKLETDRIERTFAELNERIGLANAAGSGWPSPDEAETAERQRTALNDSIVAYNSAVAANERDHARFNEAVQRYNLMMAYPDGLAEDRAKGLIR
jgi:hypothetical protein